jgi:hypothetical protein
MFYRCDSGSNGGGQTSFGTFTTQTTSSGYKTVDIGFKPKYLAIEVNGQSSSGKHIMMIYNEDVSTTQYYIANASNYPTLQTLKDTALNITNTGFTYCLTVSPLGRSARYFAIG